MKNFRRVIIFFTVLNILLISATFVYAASMDTENDNHTAEIQAVKGDNSKTFKYLGAAACVFAATLGSGLAIGKIGSAAMGALSENSEAGGTAIILAALAEGVCLWGLAGAALILFF
jgi:V/A-type H+-transporting ATPase subunit K